MYIHIYVYNYVHLWYGHTRTIASVRRSTTWNTPWTRPAARHGTRPPWMSLGNDPSTSLALLLCRSWDFAPVSSLPRLHYFFSFLFYVLSFLAILLFPYPSCYRVQGQLIEGNFLVPIACPPRTILFVLFFILTLFYFMLYFLFFLPVSYFMEPL